MKIGEEIGKINSKLGEAIDKNPVWVIQILKDVRLPKNMLFKDIASPVPHPDVIKKLIGQIDDKNLSKESNQDIVTLSYKFWHDDYVVLLIQKCVQTLNYHSQRNIAALDDSVMVVFQIVDGIPSWTKLDKKTTLPDQLWALNTRLQKQEERIEALKAYMIIVSSLELDGNRLNLIIGQISGWLLPYFETMMKFIRKKRRLGTWWVDLETSVINNAINRIIDNPAEPNLAKFEYIHSTRAGAVDQEQVKRLLDKTILLSPDDIFVLWKEKIIKLAHTNKLLVDHTVNILKQAVHDTTINLQPERRKNALDTLLVIVDRLNDKDLNTQIGEWILGFIDIVHLRPFVSGYTDSIKKLLGRKLRTFISARVKDFCSNQLPQIANQKNILETLLLFQEYWDAEALISYTDMIVRAIQSRQQLLFNLAYDLLAQGYKWSEKKKQDMYDAIDGLIVAVPQEKERWSQLLKKIM